MSSTRGRKKAVEGSAEDQLNTKVKALYDEGYFVVQPYGNQNKMKLEDVLKQPFAAALLTNKA